MTHAKPESAFGGDRLKDAQTCEHCKRFRRLPGCRYCNRCKEYLTPYIRAWARQQNPIPGEDIPEC